GNKSIGVASKGRVEVGGHKSLAAKYRTACTEVERGMEIAVDISKSILEPACGFAEKKIVAVE
ncbi:MAG TPA: hypothetical protein DCS82_11570, partial [Rhodospirillaceae bacterium]|nr:hypothetical protein [Rhodospirillaceae bacterium]